jgi:Tol biopolymer transport system component
MRFLIVPPPKTNLSDASAISPDGTQIAFIAVGGSDSTSLWVRNLSTVELHQLPGTEGANFPFGRPTAARSGFSPIQS